MKLFFIFYLCVIIPTVKTTVVSPANEGNVSNKQDKAVTNVVKQLTEDHDQQWHISHLKNSSFVNSDDSCRQDTFQDKLMKYRRMLKNDGALVNFVSAFPLPLDISDLNQGVCRVGSDVTNNGTAVLSGNETRKYDLEIEKNKTNLRKANATVGKEPKGKSSKDPILHEGVATTAKTKSKSLKFKPGDTKDDVIRRASEYMFSSAEYYDETTEFDESQCPGAVDVITLEIDHLRSYDVECESLLTWRSLD